MSIVGQQLGELLFPRQRESRLQDSKENNCSTKCPLDGMPRATLTGLLQDCRTNEDLSTTGQNEVQ
jgi:hypothetical protein